MKIILVVSFFCFSYICHKLNVKGNWRLDDKHKFSINYSPEIQFKKDNFLLMKSYGDTLFTGKYEAKRHTITLIFPDGNTNIIVHKYQNDSLILSGFKNTIDTLLYLKMDE